MSDREEEEGEQEALRQARERWDKEWGPEISRPRRLLSGLFLIIGVIALIVGALMLSVR